MNILLFYILCSYFLLTDQWRIILFSQNGCFNKKQSTSNFPKNEHFLPPDTHTYVCVSGGKKCSFFGKFYKIFNILYMSGFCGVQFLSLCLKIFRLASFFRSLGSFLPGIRLYIAEFFCSYISSRNGDTRDISLLETF